MLPYLSRYMGHATFDSTYYYIHTSPDFMDTYADITGREPVAAAAGRVRMRRDPTTGAPDFFTFARDYLHAYMPTVARRSPKTIEAYRISLECFLTTSPMTEHIERAHVSFDHFDRQHLKGWLTWMTDQRHYAPKTVALRLSAVKAFLTYCSGEDITLVALSQAAKALKGPSWPRASRSSTSPSPKHEAMLAAFTGRTAKSRRNRMLLILLYDTAARVGEITGLTLQDLCLNPPGHVRLTGKGNKTRIVPLTDKTIEHLHVYLAEFHPNTANSPRRGRCSTACTTGDLPNCPPTRSRPCSSKPPQPHALNALRSREHPLPHAAQDQGHGPLPAGHPAADHHAPPRPRERIHHSSVLRLRDPGHDAASHQRGHPRDQRRGHRAAHRGQTPSPLQSPIAPKR